MANFRYSLTQAPEARTDGSGAIDHDIVAQYDDGGGWLDVPGRHKTISIPAAEVAAALAAGGNAAIVAAYKQALADNIDTQPEPVIGWSAAQLQSLVDANNAAADAAVNVNGFVTVTLGLSYPVPFTI